MKTHELIQGSPEWLAYRATHFNASDAPAMMGCSPYKTRTQLMHELHTGLVQEVDAGTQRRFDDGHRYEALARPLAEAIIGEDLYPVVGSEGTLSASFDGLTMAEDTAFEHKSLNDELRACMKDEGNGYDLPRHYQIQMEQQLMVSGAERVLFMASKWSGDQLVEKRHCWYASDPKLAAEIRAGWAQFDLDLAAYVPTESEAPKPIGKTMESLPALMVSVRGEVTDSNLAAYRDHAMAVLGAINRELNTDQDFATAKATVRWCDDVEKRIAAGKEHILGQTQTIDAVFRTMDEISAEARRIRLDLDRLVTRRENEVKEKMVLDTRTAYNQHITSLKEETGGPWVPLVMPDFAAAIKGKRNLALMQDALNTALAAGKIAADTSARSIRANLATIDAAGYAELFADRAHLVGKAPDDLALLIKSRVEAHEAATKKIADDAAAEAIRKAAESVPVKVATVQVATETVAIQAAAVPALGIVQQIPASTLQTPAANSGSEQALIKLGDINAGIAPLTISADGLAQLGFSALPVKGAARMYLAADFPRIRAAMVAHLQKAEQLLAA